MSNQARPTTEEIRYIPLSEILADYNWNSRGQSDATADEIGFEGISETKGLESLKESLLATGQDTPILVRPGGEVQYRKVKEANALVAGFRRFLALSQIYADKKTVPGLADGCIKAVVRSADDAKARLLNLKENLGGRTKLKPHDTMAGVLELIDKHHMKLEDIGVAIGISTSYAGMLSKIGAALDVRIFNHWRNGGNVLAGWEGAVPNTRISLGDLREVSESEKGEKGIKQLTMYVDKLNNKAAEKKVKDWWAQAQKTAASKGKYLGALAKVGLFEPDATEIDWLGIVESGKLFKLDKHITAKKDRRSLAKLAETAFIEEYNRDETQEEEDEEEGE